MVGTSECILICNVSVLAVVVVVLLTGVLRASGDSSARRL